MALRVPVVVALALIALTGCDVSQKRPETLGVRASTVPASDSAREPLVLRASSKGASLHDAGARGERSIRLSAPVYPANGKRAFNA